MANQQSIMLLPGITAGMFGWAALAGLGHGQEPGQNSAPGGVEIRYRMPAIIMQAHVDWPKDGKYWDEMAKFVAENGFNCVEGNIDHLDVCRQNGLRVLLGAEDAVLKETPRLKDDPAVFGYFVSDRRKSHAFPGFAAAAREWEKADPNHPTIFINYALWNEFTRFTEEVKPMVLNFYHYHWDARRRPEFYFIFLAQFRDLGLKNGIPVMQCTASNNTPAQVRQTIYTSLAYGLQGFQFWPPWIFAHEKDDKGDAKLKDGGLSKYVTLPHLCDIAKELKILGPTLITLRSVAVFHAEPVPPGGEKTKDDSWYRLAGEEVMVGEFEDDQEQKLLMLVNRDAGQPRAATVSWPQQIAGVRRMDKTSGTWDDLPLESAAGGQSVTVQLDPGDGQLLRVSTEK